MENLKLVYRLKNIYIYIKIFSTSIRHDKKVANRTGCQTSLQVHECHRPFGLSSIALVEHTVTKFVRLRFNSSRATQILSLFHVP